MYESNYIMHCNQLSKKKRKKNLKYDDVDKSINGNLFKNVLFYLICESIALLA